MKPVTMEDKGVKVELSDEPGESYQVDRNGNKLGLVREGVDFNVIRKEEKEVYFGDKEVPYYDWVAGAEFVAVPYDKTCIDMLLEGRTYGECIEAVRGYYRKELTVGEIKRRLVENEWAAAYLRKKLKDRAIAEGLTREKYIVMAEEVVRGVRKMGAGQLFIFKHLSKVMGWEGDRGGMSFNQQINIVQKNGME